MDAARLSKLLGPHPRLRVLNEGLPGSDGRCVVYWMQRSQRGIDNPALNLAIAVANCLELPTIATFSLTADYPGAQRRHYRFLIEGLVDARVDLERRGIPLIVRLGNPGDVIPELCEVLGAAFLVGDENPLRVGQQWRRQVADRVRLPFYLVDGDVVVPSSLFPREEYAARTIRPKIHRVMNEYLKPLPEPRAKVRWATDVPSGLEIEVEPLLSHLKVGGVPEVRGYRGGTREAIARLRRFLDERISGYASERNEPPPYRTTELSAHLHFGQISPLNIALEAIGRAGAREDIDSLLEELIVRRELAINYVARNPLYDQLAGCPEWARKTLAKHALDRRVHLYTSTQLESADTHDDLWNAAQKEMVLTGRMHNYLRMYWAKKILEWSPDAETAFSIAVDLNDRYEMDGRDPNGYTGIAWAIGGKHDRPWPERLIFGTVRFMSLASTRRKFDSSAYIQRIEALNQ